MVIGGSHAARAAKLSRQERAVLAGLAAGRSTEQIATVMFVSPHTVRTHVKNGMRKLAAHTRAHAVAIAIGEGAIERPQTEPLGEPEVAA